MWGAYYVNLVTQLEVIYSLLYFLLTSSNLHSGIVLLGGSTYFKPGLCWSQDCAPGFLKSRMVPNVQNYYTYTYT